MSWTITRLWPSSLVKPYLTINDVITLSLPLFFFQERCWRKQEVVRHLWHEVGDVTTTQHTHASFINDAPCACVFVCRAPAQKHARGPNYPGIPDDFPPKKPELLMVESHSFVLFLFWQGEGGHYRRLTAQSITSIDEWVDEGSPPPCSILLRSRHFYRNHGGRGLARMVWGTL